MRHPESYHLSRGGLPVVDQQRRSSFVPALWGWASTLTIVVVLVAAITPRAAAQSEGRVTGFVHDQTGAVIPGATVVLRDEASGTELPGITDDRGLFSFDPVQPKTYTLTIQKEGFKTYSKTGIDVHPGDRLDLSANLELGQRAERVVVKASAERLAPTDSGAKVDVLTSGQIQNLSTKGRNSFELLGLLAGVVDTGFDPSSGTNLNQGPSNFSVNGQRFDQMDYRLDNVRGLDPGGLSSVFVIPNMDMIQEFSVKTSNVEADQGHAPVQIEAVTKSGGRDFHGSVYYYGRNAALNANDFSNNLAGLPKPASKFNYPGFTLGGPVRIPGTGFNQNRDKLFFFVGMEWQRQLPDPGTEFATVPTAKMRTGDFSELLNPQFCQTDGAGHITGGRYLNMPCIVTDPNDGTTALAGNVLPAGDVTSDGRIFLNLFPQPNYVDQAGGRYNYAARPLYPTNPAVANIKVDYNLSDKTRMFVRLSREAEKQYWPFGVWAGENSGWTSNIPDPGVALGDNLARSIAFNVVQTLNPTLTNEVQIGASVLHYSNAYSQPKTLSRAALGFNFKGMAFPGTITTESDIVPQITDAWSAPGGGNPGAGRWGAGNLTPPSGAFYHPDEYEISDNLAKVKGTHLLKFGFAAEHTLQDQNIGLAVEGLLVTDTSWGLTTGNEFGDILSEHYKAYGQQSRDIANPNYSSNIEWFAQDSWKFKRRLTLNYGARFSWMQPYQVGRGFLVTFDPKVYDPSQPTSLANGLLLASKGQISNSALGNPHPVIQPRLGFAWDVFGKGKSVLRGGLGIYVSRDTSNAVNKIVDSPPNSFNSGPSQQFTSLSQIESINPYGSLGNIALQVSNIHDNSTPQSYQWSITWSQMVGLSTVLETSYVGNVGRHLSSLRDLNAVPLGAMWNPGGQILGTDTNAQAFRRYAPWGAINLLSQGQTSNYNSLQVTARRNVARGLTLLAAYTWSKALGHGATGFNSTVDPFDSKRNYGLLGYDRAHNFALSYIYDLPSAGTKYFQGNRVAKGVLDNWRLSGVTHYTSGAPLSVSNGGISCKNAAGETNPASLALCSSFVGDGRTWYGSSAESVLPVFLSNPRTGVNSTGVNGPWLNPASVTLPSIGQFGNFEAPVFRTPGFNKWDTTLFKEFSLSEMVRLQFRLAAFDLFNRAQLDAPSNSAQFQWNLPLGATSLSQGSASLANPGSFGIITDKRGHREVEYGIKVIF